MAGGLPHVPSCICLLVWVPPPRPYDPMSNPAFRWYARLLWAVAVIAVLLFAFVAGIVFFALVV